ncbi:MAG: prepilin-type N-terminal cleavage/methylation domain-containing protein [Nitrospirota bacterium]
MKGRTRNDKGFTLIELAIVLVIIGIIIGAVLKGQDLVDSARHKKLAAEIKQWEVATWTYLDRKGKFPGESGDGTIGNNLPSAENVQTDFSGSGLAIAPATNQLTLGSATFYLFLGSAGARKNIIAVCASGACNSDFGDDGVAYAEAVDAALDGEISGTGGRVRGAGAAVAGSSSTWVATTTGSYAAYTSSTKALLYFFDKKP